MRTKLGLKVLGLSALVMGVMAIGTTGAAQAETGACWGYLSFHKEAVTEKIIPLGSLECFSAGLEASTSVALENSTGTLLVGNQNIEVLCTGVAFIEGGTLSANGSILLGRVEFSGCISLSKTPTLTKLNSCTPKDPVTGSGRVRTEKGLGLLVLHNGVPVVELKPDTAGGALAKIFLGEECSIGEELIVTGKLILSDIGGKTGAETHALSHLIQEFPDLKLMKVGGVTSTIDGTANVTLLTPHNNLLWASKGL